MTAFRMGGGWVSPAVMGDVVQERGIAAGMSAERKGAEGGARGCDWSALHARRGMVHPAYRQSRPNAPPWIDSSTCASAVRRGRSTGVGLGMRLYTAPVSFPVVALARGGKAPYHT